MVRSGGDGEGESESTGSPSGGRVTSCGESAVGGVRGAEASVRSRGAGRGRQPQARGRGRPRSPRAALAASRRLPRPGEARGEARRAPASAARCGTKSVPRRRWTSPRASSRHASRSQGVQQHDASHPTRLVATDAAQVKYDAAGNMVDVFVHRPGAACEASLPCNQRFAYEWDEVGQLARARRWDLPVVDDATPRHPEPAVSPPAYELTYAYSGGQRTLKTSVEPSGDAHTLEVFGSLRVNRAAFEDGDYLTTAENEAITFGRFGRVVYGNASLPGAPGPHPRLLIELGDQLGSASVMLDQETGEVVEKITYDANGVVESDYRPERWGAFREDMRFTGKEEDIEVGLTYFGARYLSTNLRRWISPDPLTVHGWGADPNPYAYVSGRTMSAVDPWGLSRMLPDGTQETDEVVVEGEAPAPSPAPPASQPTAEVAERPVDPRVAAHDARIDRLTGRDVVRALVPDTQGALRFRGYSYHLPDVPLHAVNEVVRQGIESQVQISGLGSAQKAIHFYTGRSIGVSEAAEAVERHTKIPIANRGEGDVTRGVVALGVAAVQAVATAGAAGGAAAKAAAAEGAAAEGVTIAPRALTAADMGLAGTDAIVEGTMSVKNGQAIAKVAYLGSPGGLGSAGLRVFGALKNAARAEGATGLRIETTRIIEPTGRLQPLLKALGFQLRTNGTMFFEGPI